MHVQRLSVQNIRSIDRLDLRLAPEELAGWHVILGDNGAGKTTLVRALAVALVGEANAHASRQDWSHWLSEGQDSASISVQLKPDERDGWTGSGRRGSGSVQFGVGISLANNGETDRQARIKFSNKRYASRTIWGNGDGWFSASFGAFRRFAGSDPAMDRLYLSHHRLAAHLSAFGENVALGESLRWLQTLKIQELTDEPYASEILRTVIAFINRADLLPHGTRIDNVTSERVYVVDGRGSCVDVEEMSDGYRSILSLVFELLRLLFSAYGSQVALKGIDGDAGIVKLSGVVAIDEIDAHLHPNWQKRIGTWFVEHFPSVQFFVTTHSPLICRAAQRGSVWLLPTPGSSDNPKRIRGNDLDRLVLGSVLEAYSTELFGKDVVRSSLSKARLERLAHLNQKRFAEELDEDEMDELNQLRSILAATPNASTIG